MEKKIKNSTASRHFWHTNIKTPRLEMRYSCYSTDSMHIGMQPQYVRQRLSTQTMVDYGDVGVDKTNDLKPCLFPMLHFSPYVSCRFSFVSTELVSNCTSGFLCHTLLTTCSDNSGLKLLFRSTQYLREVTMYLFCVAANILSQSGWEKV